MKKILLSVLIFLPVLLASCSGNYGVNWRTDLGEPVTKSPAHEEGKLFVSLKEGAVACLDSGSGEVLWKTRVNGWLNTSPAIDKKVVYAGTSEGNIAVLDKLSGEMINEYYAGGTVTSEISITDSTLYFSHMVISKETSERLGILNAVDKNNWKLKWQYPTTLKTTSKPLISDESVYFGSWDMSIYCLNKETGEKIWSYETNSLVFGTSRIYKGMLYSHSDDHCLYKLDPVTGQLAWKVEICYFYDPVFYDGEIFITCREGNMSVISPEDGSLLWRYTHDESILETPVIIAGTAYIVDVVGELTAVDLMDRSKKWSFRGKGKISGPPVLNNIYLFTGTDEGFVYSINTEG